MLAPFFLSYPMYCSSRDEAFTSDFISHQWAVAEQEGHFQRRVRRPQWNGPGQPLSHQLVLCHVLLALNEPQEEHSFKTFAGPALKS